MSGPECSVNPDAYRLVSGNVFVKKPIGAICIAPTMIAKIINELEESAILTIGKDQATANDIKTMGSTHEKNAR